MNLQQHLELLRILATLPPEIRNRIYEYLFQRDRPVILDDGQAHVELWAGGHAIHYKHGGFKQQVRKEDLCEVFAGCTGLLLSCRQIYHEAVGILYGQNTFFFSRFLENQMHFTSKWLSTIGSHYQLLSYVHIDADVSVPKCTRGYNLLPLLKLIWNHSQAKCIFTFVLPASSLSKDRKYDTELYGRATSADIINGVLFALGAKDVLNLRQYARYSCLISSIMVWSNENGCVGYVENTDPDIPRSSPHTVRDFDILDRGSKVKWADPQQLTLPSLPHELLSVINTYANASDTDIVFDLDTKKAHVYHVGLSGVNDLLRFDIDRMATRVYDEIVIRMSTQEATTDFDDFKALQNLLAIENFGVLINPDERREAHCSIDMILMFKLSTPKSAEDLRINISQLLHLFIYDHEDLVITVQESNGSTGRTRFITWNHVQCAVFLLLSDLLEQYPSEAHRPLPHIWINGRGTVLHATYPATATSEERIIPYASTSDDPTNVHAQGYRKIKGVEQGGTMKNIAGAYYHSHTVSLVGMWSLLRNHLWTDWQRAIWSIES
ncbi:hypothetical protein J4E91_002248 [Alternaria rosae]|nr:hypothetical protein J4E91_002248 [Alternaria rosae]